MSGYDNSRQRSDNRDNDEFQEVLYDEMDFDRETPKAYHLIIDKKKVWIPKSQCQEPDMQKHTIMVKAWIVHEKGLEAYLVDEL